MGGPEDRRAADAAVPVSGELRAIADQMLAIVDQLRALEERKRSEAMGSAEFVTLAEAAEAQGRLVFRWTGLQLDMARQAAQRRALGQLDADIRISDVQPRPLDLILAAWREAQIRLEIAPPGTDDAARAADEIERLREEYQAVASSKADEAATLARHPGSSAPFERNEPH